MHHTKNGVALLRINFCNYFIPQFTVVIKNSIATNYIHHPFAVEYRVWQVHQHA